MAANLGIAATKFLVGAITGSTVIIAEGIHSLVDTGNSALMLLGEQRSRRPADEAHPCGYGIVVAMVVFGGGGGLSIYEGIRALFHPRTVTNLWLNYLVIGAAAVFGGASLSIGVREFTSYRRQKRFEGSMLSVMRASKNPAIFVTVLEDSAALVGVAIAAGGLTVSHYCAHRRRRGDELRTLQLGADSIMLVLRISSGSALTGRRNAARSREAGGGTSQSGSHNQVCRL